MTETWYVMEDGSAADPREIAWDDRGGLRHRDGRAVACAPHGPRTRSVDPDVERMRAGIVLVDDSDLSPCYFNSHSDSV